MTVMESGSEILKVDEAGRVRTPPEKREAVLAEFDRSGMTGASKRYADRLLPYGVTLTAQARGTEEIRCLISR